MNKRRKIFQIAIDGPVGAGKSTVAKLVAERLQILYIDTGAMYRAVALKALWEGVKWEDEIGVVSLVQDLKLELKPPLGEKQDGRKVTVWLEDKDVSWEIRQPGIGEGASIVSQYPEVRKVLVEKQRKMAENQSVVMEGRDIGTRVLPQASLKIYMDADLEIRAKRKLEELLKLGKEVSLEEVRKAILRRDEREMTREVDPLRPAEGAWILDTSDLRVEEVVNEICRRVESPLFSRERRYDGISDCD